MKALGTRPGVVATALLSIVILAVPVRVARESRTELSSATAAATSGDHVRATDHYRRALRWWLPIIGSREAAIAGLEDIARTREAAGDRDGALLAWRSIVGGLASTRTLYSSPSRASERAKNEIARLAVREDDAGSYRALLDRKIAPEPLGGTFLVFGFLLWLASLVLLIGRGFDRLGRLDPQAAHVPLLGALAGFASFVIGLLFA